jgi:hypothetical protein
MKRNGHVFFVIPLVALIVVGRAAAEPLPAKNFVVHLDGGQEVPERDTRATGQAIFQLNPTESALTYRLIVANIENVVAAHIHLGLPGVNGPVVAFLAGNFLPAGGRVDGVLATGTITEANLVGPLANMPLSVLVAAMRAGGTYANVHTNDGVPPANEGPGDFPGGEIRGEIQPAGP